MNYMIFPQIDTFHDHVTRLQALSNMPHYSHFFIQIYAPSDADIIEKDTLRDILTSLGFADLSDDDVVALLDALDSDGDGVVGQSDFVQLLKTNGGNVLKKDPRRNMR